MIRFSLRWLIPRLGFALMVVSFIQLVAYMGVIPKTSLNDCPTTKIVIKEIVIDRKTGCKRTQEDGKSKSIHSTGASEADIKNGRIPEALRKEQKLMADKLKKLALELIDTQRDLVTLAPIYHRVGQHINTVNDLLRSIEEKEVVSKINKNNSKKPPINVVCPEKFMGPDLSLGYPWFRKGFATLNCTDSVPINKLISVVLHFSRELPSPAHDLYTILQHIAKLYPGISVALSLTGSEQESLKKKTFESKLNIPLTIHPIKSQKQGQILSSLLNDVKTPYVFIGSDVTHFTDDVNLERLVRVVSTNEEVIIAGGGYRNQRGQWDVGCLQTVFRNWTMHVRGGYYHSFGDCLVCDHVEGPWVANTDRLKKLGFDKKLQYGVFHDLFLRLKKSFPGSIAVTCPDVMFNIYTDPVEDSKYVQLANKWDIKKWVEADGKVRWYGCRRGYQHNSGSSTCSLTKGLANPPCELENLADAIKFVMRECENAGMFCELQEGTLLGAVKFNKVLPWERDADITFLTANYTAFKKLRPKFVEQGYSLSDDDPSLWCCADGRTAGGKFRVGASTFTIEMYGQHMMESELLAASGQPPTKIHFAGEWVNVVRNPGLYARNRYGPNHFRHAEHWMDLGHSTGWSFYNPGQFSPCPSPGHSGCLDQYPADGNMQFSDYTTL